MGTFTPVLQGKLDVALSNFAREFRNAAFVADRIFSRVEAGKQTSRYWIFGREALQDPGDELRAPTAAAIELTQTLSSDVYFADDHAASRLIAHEERAAFEAGDVDRWATEMLVNRLLLKKEIRARNVATDPSNYAASNQNTLAGTSQWTDTVASDPIADVLAARKQVGLIGRPANLMVMGPDSFEALKKHPKITERFVNVKAGAITAQDLTAVFEVPVAVAEGVFDNAGVVTYIWPDTVWIGYAQEAPNFFDVSFGKTFLWGQAPGTARGFAVEVNPVFPMSRKADSVDAHFYYDQKVTCKEAGYIIIDTNA